MSNMLEFMNVYCDSADNLLSKIVIRRLPPDFTLDIFKEQVSPIAPHNYFYFVKASGEGQHLFSRAYINFLYYRDLLDFKEKYDNYVFLSQNGTEYTAVVEFAPYQNVPQRNLKRKDVKCSTIQNDKYFLNFIESTKNKTKIVERPEFDLQLKSESKNVTLTPLLKYISEKRNERKITHNRHNSFKDKAAENCIVFVNSTIKKSNYKFSTRTRKSNFLNSYNTNCNY